MATMTTTSAGQLPSASGSGSASAAGPSWASGSNSSNTASNTEAQSAASDEQSVASQNASTSQHHHRKGSSSGSSSTNSRRNNAMNPAFGMTSNDGPAVGPSRSPPATSSSSRVKRNHKSSDRLHRLGGNAGSSTHLAGKRNKSHTQLAAAGGGGGGAGSGGGAGGAGRRKKSASKGSRDAEATGSGNEDGWASATPEPSTPNSPARQASGDEDDEGLTMGARKKPTAAPAVAAAAASAAPPALSSARAAPQLRTAPESRNEATPPPPSMNRSDTSKTLVADSDEPAGFLAFPRGREEMANVSSLPLPRRGRSDSDDTLGGSNGISTKQTSSSDATRTPDVNVPAAAATSSSSSTPLKGPGRPQPHLRISSSASNKTLTGSPSSTLSRLSTRSRTLSLMPRDRHAAAPPMLSTHNALAGNLGALQERRGDEFMSVPSRSFSTGMTHSPSAPAYLHEGGGKSLRRIGSSASIGSNITLPGGSATVGYAQRSTASRAPIPPELSRAHGGSGSGGSGSSEAVERRRTESTRSLTAADAAKLAAKLRQARDAMDEQQGGGGGSGGAYVGASAARSGASASLAHASLEGNRHSKPVVSIFAKEQERRGKPTAVAVKPNSVWSAHFISSGQVQGRKEAASSQQRQSTRYVGLYGLGGPPIEKTPLNDALLAPSFDGDEFEASWAPALANAAGLGARTSHGRGIAGGHGAGGVSSDLLEDGTPFHDPTMSFSGSAAVNGPNATPVHLIHGLTAISPEPFPLDPADAPTLDIASHHQHPQSGSMSASQSSSLMAEPATLRAIALTSQVLSTHRSHEMTRRYFDPMREGLDRALRPSARAALAAAAAASASTTSSASPAAGGAAAAGSRGATRSMTAPSSPRTGSGSSAGGRLTPNYQRPAHRSSGQSQSHLHLTSLGEAAAAAASSNPVQGLKRVWSSATAGGAMSRGGSGNSNVTLGGRR